MLQMPLSSSSSKELRSVSDNKVDDVSLYDTNVLLFYVNGNRVEERMVDPMMTLATYLRDHLRLTGTKIGCNEGGCGACTVMISERDPLSGEIRHFSANSCLMPICGVFGKAVTTVEALGNVKDGRLHAVQERLAKTHGSQCGFCTPGFVMAMYSLLRNTPEPSVQQINEAMQGNLCRCTGYRPILEAFYSFAKADTGDLKITETGCGLGEKCCKVNGNGNGNLTDLSTCAPYDPTHELIFPPELTLKHTELRNFAMAHDSTVWYQPAHLADLLVLKRLHPHARVISGNSELAVERKFRFIDLPIVINPRQVVELHEFSLDIKRGVYLATGLSLTQMDERIGEYRQQLEEFQSQTLLEAHKMMHWFAGKHVRNVASIAGNIATASPISDLNPLWMASGTTVVLESEERGERELIIDEKFFVGYRKTTIASDEIVKAIWIPLTEKHEHVTAYKQAARREDDIAIVTGAFCTLLDAETQSVKHMRISYGGMAPTTILALRAMEKGKGRRFDWSLLERVTCELASSLVLPAGVPGGMPRYRLALALSFFYKHFLEVARRENITSIPESIESTKIGESIPQDQYSTQSFTEISSGQAEWDAVGRPIPHVSGQKHTTGEAIYCGDINVPNCLHGAFVTSKFASGILESIDASKALSMPGVVAFFDASDVRPGAKIGHGVGDTDVFVEREIRYNGQPLGLIVATDHETARRGANAVVVNATQKKAIVTIEDALDAKSFICPDMHIHSTMAENNGEQVVSDWNKYDRVVEGTIRMGGQEHFYLECHQCVVIPHEDDELEIVASTQCVADVQTEVGKCLGIPRNKIRVSVRRIGGGFGGKESTAPLCAVPAAIAAIKLRRPVRITLERFDDMAISGNRHPFRFDYKVAVDDNGKLVDMNIACLQNAGHTFDLSIGVIHRCMVHLDNVYHFPRVDVIGKLCKTNLASNTAYRGFGGPQGMFATESIMTHVAEQLGMDIDEFREKNMYESSAKTFWGNSLDPCNARRCWDECIEKSDYYNRKQEAAKFNKLNKYRKRGVALTPTKFSIGFGLKHLNQASALVLIYTDGSVLVSHGGMEMGQGLHTKIIQITSRCLGIDATKIHIQDAATDKVPNASPTAASMGSDLNGLAVQNACDQLNERLAELKNEMPEATWEKLVETAYLRMISLSASGFATTPCDPVDFGTGAPGGEMFSYAVYGTAFCEVEIDCLTGDHHLLRTEIVMDVGDSLNPAIDIGQIEGAFIQGYGLFTMEEIKVRPDGVRLSRGPGAYKIPSADDAPRHFSVHLLKGSSNKNSIFSSKAIGEPPLFLGSCALFAIRNAIKAFRSDQGLFGYFRFDSPATAERIRLACEDELLEKVPALPKDKHSFTPWVVDL
ncbi:xdh-1 [Pristionchus pacificus]|nr:xdh-1 [Pristionchus pacificus]